MKKVLILSISLLLAILIVSCLGGGTGDESSPIQPNVVAHAGPDQYVPVGSTVTLDGSGSFSSEGYPLLYHWYLVQRPPGSNAAGLPINSFDAHPTFTADVEGLYEISLTVTEFHGDATASPSSDTVFVIAPPLAVFGGANEDIGYSVQQTTDEGCIVTGKTDSMGFGEPDVYLIKIDAAGNLVWEKTFGGISNDYGYSVQQTIDGGYVVAGSTLSLGLGGSDVYLIKTDAAGDFSWEKTFGGINGDTGYSVKQTIDGGYVVAGSTYSTGSGESDVYLIKTDAAGNLVWEKTFGGISYDVGRSVQQTSDGGYVVAGFSDSMGSGRYNVYLIKTDTVGNLLWEKTFGGSNDDDGYSVQQTSDGGYIVAGYTGSMGFGGQDVYLIKTDADGNLLWEKTFGGSNDDDGYSVQQTSDGGYVVAGSTYSTGFGGSDMYLIKTDAAGNLAWKKSFGGLSDDFGYSVQQTIDGEYVVAGKSRSMGLGGFDVYLVKTDGSSTTW